MIDDKETALQVSEMLLKFGKEIDDAILHIKNSATDAEFRVFRQNMGCIMGEILLHGLNPLYQRHPELKPKDFQ